MYKRSIHGILLAGLLGFSVAVQAQEGTDLQQRIEDLTAEWREVNRLAGQMDSLQSLADSVSRANTGRDTVTTGFVRVIFDRDNAPSIRPAVMVAASRAERALGPAMALLDGTAFSVDLTNMRIRTRPFEYQTATRVSVSTDVVAGIARETSRNSSGVTESVSNQLFNAINLHIQSLVPEVMTRWAGTISPLNPRYEMRRSYLDLIANPQSAARACWRRDYNGCKIGLGLVPSADPVLDWYSEADRRLIITAMDVGGVAEFQILKDRCLHQSNSQACASLMRFRNYLNTPLEQFHRRDVVVAALSAGGQGAFSRLVQSSGSVVERLEATAQLPIDSILVRWRDEIDRAAGNPVRVATSTGLRTMLWVLVFMIAATGSSRWRSR